MNSGSNITALEKLLKPMRHNLTMELARALVNLQADAETQLCYDNLAEKRTDGTLTAGEVEELEAIVRANTLLGLLQAEAHSMLALAKSA